MMLAFGESYDVKFDGKDYPVKGPDAARTVSLKKVNDRSIDLTIKRDGKIVGVNHMTVSADGKTLTVKMETKAENRTRFVYLHQAVGTCTSASIVHFCMEMCAYVVQGRTIPGYTGSLLNLNGPHLS